MSYSISEQVSLKAFNTLAIDANATYFVEVTDESDLPDILWWSAQRQLSVLVLGGGSNVVFSEHFPGLVLHMHTRGITVEQDGNDVIINVAAGENWHQLVCWSLQQGYSGIENLALIPGTAGAAPIQNIGAYGVELSDCLISVSGWDRKYASVRTLLKEECRFGYRESVFKHELKDRFIITSIKLRLSCQRAPQIHYQVLSDYLSANGINNPSAQQVADAVIAIRQSKLPDPEALPNVGSFFKNPVVSALQHEGLRQQYPALISYQQPDGDYKLAAGWMIEKAGWKGYCEDSVGVHTAQALVLINHGNATGKAVLALAKRIQSDIQQRFGVGLDIEPCIIGSA